MPSAPGRYLAPRRTVGEQLRRTPPPPRVEGPVNVDAKPIRSPP